MIFLANKIYIFILNEFNPENNTFKYEIVNINDELDDAFHDTPLPLYNKNESSSAEKNNSNFIHQMLIRFYKLIKISENNIFIRFYNIIKTPNNKVSKGIFRRKAILKLKKKLKLFYILLLPYGIMIYKLFISKALVKLN